MLFMIIGIIVVASLLTIIISMMFRVVVETNKVNQKNRQLPMELDKVQEMHTTNGPDGFQ